MDHPLDQIHFSRAVPQMNVYDACLSGKHPCYPGVRRDPGEFLKGGLRRTVIGNRHLADPDDLVQHHNVLHQAVRQRLDRHAIGACIRIGRNSFGLQSMGLCQQGRHISGHAVCADAADHRSDAVQNQIFQIGLRRPGGKAALAASAHDMLMAVDKAGHGSHALRVQLLCLHAAAEVRLQLLSDRRDFSIQHQDVFDAGVLRLIDLCVSNQCNHCHIRLHLSFSPPAFYGKPGIYRTSRARTGNSRFPPAPCMKFRRRNS